MGHPSTIPTALYSQYPISSVINTGLKLIEAGAELLRTIARTVKLVLRVAAFDLAAIALASALDVQVLPQLATATSPTWAKGKDPSVQRSPTDRDPRSECSVVCAAVPEAPGSYAAHGADARALQHKLQAGGHVPWW